MAEAVEKLEGAYGEYRSAARAQVADDVERAAEGRLAHMLEELGGVISTGRDPRDLRLIGILSISSVVLAIALSACIGLLIFKEFKKPTVITVVKSGNDVVEINDLSQPTAGAMGVSMRPGDITDDEKLQIAEALARGLYRINPVTRADDNRQLVDLMVGPTATEFVNGLKSSGMVRRQVDEKWSASWTKMDSSVVGGMPNTVRVLGRQDLIKVINGQRVEESHTYSIDVVLTVDEKGRDARNLNTGLRVLKFTIREIRE